MIRAVLIDADGVAIVAPEPFSRIYARERGLPEDAFESFFQDDFHRAMEGKTDLLELLRARQDLWQWQGDPRDLMQRWFEAENYPSAEVVAAVRALREDGKKVYLATNQEQHRLDFLNSTVFPGVFDDMIASCTLGFRKPSNEFFAAALERVRRDIPDISAVEVAFYDDSARNVEAARAAGIHAAVYQNADQIRHLAE